MSQAYSDIQKRPCGTCGGAGVREGRRCTTCRGTGSRYEDVALLYLRQKPADDGREERHD